VFVPDHEPSPARHEGKISSELRQEALQSMEDRRLEISLAVRVREAQEIQQIRVS
jgi:hypothetical protein